MGKSFCEDIVPYYPSVSEAEVLRPSYITNCVFAIFLNHTTIMLNIVTIHAVKKTPSLRKPLKTLLLSLIASDLGVSLFVQPLYIWLLIRWLQQTHPGCHIYTFFSVVMNLFVTASFSSVVGITLERFLAIYLHLRYQELVTYKRVKGVVIFIWLISAFFSLRMFWLPPGTKYIVLAVAGVVSVLFTSLLYCKIYLVFRRHKNHIQALHVPPQQLAQNGETAAYFASLQRSAIGTFYVYLVFLVCYIPRFICLGAIKIYGPEINLKIFSIYSLTLMFLNSSLNPLIYCWKLKRIRHALLISMRKISWCR